MKTREELAKELANNAESIKGKFQCPRDIKNPGIWFGFMEGYEHGVRAVQQIEFEKKIRGLDNDGE